MTHKKGNGNSVKEKKSNHSYRTTIIFCLLLLTVLTMGVTFSKYMTESNGSDEARVAQYVMEISGKEESTFSAVLDDLKKPGDSTDIVFIVTNKSDKGISEVAQKYDVSYSTTENLPLTFVLEGEAEENDPGTINSSKNGGTMQAAQESVHSYTLKINWPAGETNVALANEIDKITVQVKAEQID